MSISRLKDERRDVMESEMASPALQRQNKARKQIEDRTFDMEEAVTNADYFEALFREVDV